MILEPGQVLYVPRHWWHFVESLEDSISVNTWIEMVRICRTEKHAYSRMQGTFDLDLSYKRNSFYSIFFLYIITSRGNENDFAVSVNIL